MCVYGGGITSIHIHIKITQIDHKPKCNTYNYKTLDKSNAWNLYDLQLGKDLLDITSKA